MDAVTSFTDLGVLPCTLDGGIAERAAIGLLVLATDQTMEHEFRHLIRLPGVAVYGARLYNDANITPETLRAMCPLIAPTTELILPGVSLMSWRSAARQRAWRWARKRCFARSTAHGRRLPALRQSPLPLPRSRRLACGALGW